jgi:hypothetical protein
MPLSGRVSRCLLALLLAGFVATTQAVEFDEKLKAPAVTEPAAFRTQAQAFKSRVAALRASGPRELLSNRTLFREQFDLTWQLQRALDGGRPVGDLAELGFVPRDDGSYAIDYNTHPEWQRFDELFVAMLPSAHWDALAGELRARGFRDADLDVVREYLRTHDARRTSLRQSLPLAIGFSKLVKKFDRIKRRVPDELALSYLYQRARIDAEAKREWADGLLAALDAQRSRILMSYFEEMTSTGVITPDNQQAGVAGLLNLMRLPDFDQLATAEAQGATVQGATP